MKILLSIMRPFLAYLLLSLGTFFTITMIIDYASFQSTIHFLQFKQEYLPITAWRIAFYVHVFSSVLALMAGFTQFSDNILKNYKQLHRSVGKMYVFTILFINFPAGMILAIYANGLWPTKLAFIILDCLWFYFTLRGFTAILKGKIEEHRAFMIRSFALTFSAITLRFWKIILNGMFHPDPLLLYMIDAWMGFVPNLLFAEWLIWRQRKKALALKTEHVEEGDKART